MFRETVPVVISAAHHLRNYEGKCQNIHGHNWKVLVSFEGKQLDSRGMLVDFVFIKKQLELLVSDRFDHKDLNEIHPFKELRNPTAENLAEVIYYTKWDLPPGVKVTKVTVYETEDNCVEYWE